MAWPYWREGERVKAWGLLALLVILLLGQTRFAVLLNELTGEFTSALAARDEPRFWDAIRTCVLVVLAAVPIMALFYYVRDKQKHEVDFLVVREKKPWLLVEVKSASERESRSIL